MEDIVAMLVVQEALEEVLEINKVLVQEVQVTLEVFLLLKETTEEMVVLTLVSVHTVLVEEAEGPHQMVTLDLVEDLVREDNQEEVQAELLLRHYS